MNPRNMQFANVCRLSALFSLLLTLLFVISVAHAQDVHEQTAASGAEPEGGDAAATGRKLSNPLGDVWALFTEFDTTVSNGRLTAGDQQAGSRMIYQPILPIPLSEHWRFITRPTIPVLFRQPVPVGAGMVDETSGVGDIQVPMVISPSVDHWILGAGPTWLFPTATRRAFGRDQWGVGPAVVVGHYTDKVIVGVFPQYFFGIGSHPASSAHDASYMNLLYFMYYNLPKAWQVGFSPTITYDQWAGNGNKWNVPAGVAVSKTTKLGGLITKFELGVEYSVVHQEAFGQRTTVRFSVIPVIPSLVHNPLFGHKEK